MTRSTAWTTWGSFQDGGHRAGPARAPKPEAIGAFCIGTNQIDLDTATDMGVAVFNAPYSNTRSVVELAIGEIIDLSRRVTVKNSRLHRGVWDKSADGAHEVRGHTLGIIGYGNIGTQLSVLAEAMGLNVIFYDAAERLALGNATQMPTMEPCCAKPTSSPYTWTAKSPTPT